jgi:hypothetical protein
MVEITEQVLLDAAKVLVLPAVGFLAGFTAQWFLQERKSRDELVRALAEERASAVRHLWKLTTVSPKIAVLDSNAKVPAALREQANRAIVEWYTTQGGALYLSWTATQVLFRLLDVLRSETARRADLEYAVSELRTQIKLDCGIYSRREAGRQLKRPRPSPWTADAPDEPTTAGNSTSSAHLEH